MKLTDGWMDMDIKAIELSKDLIISKVTNMTKLTFSVLRLQT